MKTQQETKMKKLKTLKDFQGNEYEEDCPHCKALKELKEEAINWIKEFRTDDFEREMAITTWIKHFFNITDELN